MVKTDIWMPVFIGDYLADTMHLSTEQHGAYLLLLFHLWRRGSLRDENAVLAKISGLGENAWNLHRPVLAEFFKIHDGLWEHGRVEKERARVTATKQSNASKAKLAAWHRWSKVDASSIAQAMPGDADSESESQIISPLSAVEPIPASLFSQEAASSGLALLSCQEKSFGLQKKPSDPRHAPFRAILAQYWRTKNHASPEMPWQGRDAKALGDFLAACPRLNETQFRQMVDNRARSAVAHGDRVYLWISNLTRFQEEITVYNKPASAGGGYASRAEINRNSVVSAVDGAFLLAQERADRVRQTGAEPAGFDDPGVPAADGPGPGRCAVALPGNGHHWLAAGDAAYGETGTDGPLPYRAPATTASQADRDGRQEVSAW